MVCAIIMANRPTLCYICGVFAVKKITETLLTFKKSIQAYFGVKSMNTKNVGLFIRFVIFV